MVFVNSPGDQLPSWPGPSISFIEWTLRKEVSNHNLYPGVVLAYFDTFSIAFLQAKEIWKSTKITKFAFFQLMFTKQWTGGCVHSSGQ